MSTNHSPESPSNPDDVAQIIALADPNVTYRLLQNSIHEFVFLSNQPQGITTWARTVGSIIEQLLPAETMRQLLDVRQGVAPLSHLIHEIRGLQRKFPKQPHSRLAVVSENSFAPTLFNVLISLIPTSNVKVRYFKPDERDEAVRWLLEND